MQVNRYKIILGIFFAAFWITWSWGFIADEFVPGLHSLDTLRLIFVDAIVLFAGLACLKNRFDIVALLSFIAISFFSSFVFGQDTILVYLNGFRDYIGLLFVVPILRYLFTSDHAVEFKKTFDRNLLVWLYIQAVCITWQFIRYGAGDHGGGSYGEGGSGIVSMMIYVVSFYLIAPHWDSSRFWQSLKENKKYIFLLYPTFLNETKISFVLALVYFVLLIKFDKSLILRLVYILPLSLLVLAGMLAAYNAANNRKSDYLLGAETYTDYLYGNDLEELISVAQDVADGVFDDYMHENQFWSLDIPRFAKIALMVPIIDSTRGGLLFGVGIGQFKGLSTGRETEFYKNNTWLLEGTRPDLLVFLIELGIVGVLWVLTYLSVVIFRGKASYPRGKHIRLYIALCLIAIMFYNDSLRDISECILLFYVLFAVRYFNADTTLATSANQIEISR